MKSINENEMKENIAGDGHFSARSSVFLVFLFFFSKNCIILGMLWLSGIMAVEYNYPE